MHPRSLDARNKQAEDRIVTAAQVLAKGANLTHHVERLESARHNDYLIGQLLKREALADLLEAVIEAQEAAGDPFAHIPDAHAVVEDFSRAVRRGRPKKEPVEA